MNKREASEIKRAIGAEPTAIHTIYTTYVNTERKKLSYNKVSMIDINEDELEQYVKILQKVLSSKIEKNLINLEFKKEESEENINKLYKLSKLDNEDDLENFIDEIIEHYENDNDYSIIAGFGSYDVPVKAKDDQIQDFSDYSYNFMVVAICPMGISKSNLIYAYKENDFFNSKANLIVSAPQIGFVYPSLTAREPNANELAYYVKKPSESHEEIKDLLGLVSPMTADEQKEKFTEIAEEAFGGSVEMDSVISINEKTRAYLKEKEQEEENGKMERLEINNLLKSVGSDYELEEPVEIMAENIADKDYVFELEGIKITVKGDYIDYISKEEVNGRTSIVIPLSGEVTLNGVKFK